MWVEEMLYTYSFLWIQIDLLTLNDTYSASRKQLSGNVYLSNVQKIKQTSLDQKSSKLT